MATCENCVKEIDGKPYSVLYNLALHDFCNERCGRAWFLARLLPEKAESRLENKPTLEKDILAILRKQNEAKERSRNF